MSRENYWFAIGVPWNVTINVQCLAIYLLQHKVTQIASKRFKWRKRGANKVHWWVFSGKCFQDKYQKYNFIGEDCKAKCAKTWKLVLNIKAWQLQHLTVHFFPSIGFIVRGWCSMSRVGLIHCNKHDEMFRLKNDRHHFVGLLASNVTLGKQRSFAFYARLC